MGSRRKSRQFALQLLYAYEIYQSGFESYKKDFWEDKPVSDRVKEYTIKIVDGVLENQVKIDSMIQDKLNNWKLSRISSIERNILRIAVFEFLNGEDIPKPVIINEAIEIAKRFGDGDSGHFVNGVLDAVRKTF